MKFNKIIKRATTGNAVRIVAGLGLSVPLLLAGPAAFAALDLGPAGNFAVFEMGTNTAGGSWTSSTATINGDVAFRSTSPGGSSATVITGSAIGPNASAPSWSIAGGYTQVADATLQAIAQQARDFSTAAVALGVGLPSIGTISTGSSYTFSAANLAEPGTYIVNASSLNMGNGTFTFNAGVVPAGARVIVNVLGNWNLGGGSGAIIALNGLDPSQVLFNITGTGTGSGSGARVPGTVLMPNGTWNVGNSGMIISGSLIAQNVVLYNNITVNGISFVPEPSSVMAASLLLLPFGIGALRVMRRRQTLFH